MLFALQVLVDLAVHLDVLQRAVEHNQHFGVDGPVVQVADVALEDELEGAQRRHLVLVLGIKTLQQI